MLASVCWCQFVGVVFVYLCSFFKKQVQIRIEKSNKMALSILIVLLFATQVLASVNITHLLAEYQSAIELLAFVGVPCVVYI